MGVIILKMSLLKFLKENENSRKIFGKRELKIIEKQIMGVNLTQSEKNRLSRDIRKKFEFIQEVSKFSTEFKLKKGIMNKELIERVKEKILKDELLNKIKRIFLFGSAAERELTLMSDIDIAVEFDKTGNQEAFEFRRRISRDFSDRLDIQVYNALPEKIKKEINEHGKIIWKKE
jgi:predicted nucleotidyltransferase